MAQLIKLQLSRNDQSSPWGFRLQGGKDFGTQLLIQKVNFGSLAEKAGLQVGDALVRVNGQDVYDVKHKDAQDVILRAGNAFELTIQRGGTSVWKPSITPIGPSPVPNRLSQSPQLVTKTSLAKVGPQSPAFGSSHNSVTRPFSGTSSPKVGGNDSGTVKAIVNKQYNTPVGIYSEENIAETLTAQAEVLAGGVLGVNFKKNEKNYDASHSEVLKMVQEADKEPRDLEPEFRQCVIDPIIKSPMRHVSAPEPKAPQNAPNQSICSECERLVVGSHPPLGSFNITPTKSKDVQSVQSPQPSTLSPIPFHTPSKVFSNAKPYEAPKQTPTPPKFTGGSNQVIQSGGQPVGRTGASAGLTAPRRGRGVLNPQNLTPGARVPLCGQCNLYIRGPFITALGKIWCPEHFICTNEKCRRPLQDIGFVEEDNGLYCEYCFEQYLAPVCNKCTKKIKGDCLNAIGKQFHPECFKCTYCSKLFGNSPFFLEDSLPYCEEDWNELFTTKCIACGFPIEAGDRWVEALNNNYHSPCFNCSKCKVNLEGQSFFAKGGRPFCKSHAR
ncbi:Hypothetical protein CINCED_3A005226 [Cinara cedri]|uniref:PDZ and LIM domain protein Zasp n=1 Tax=Cinara cedri TaxID=506608 RepID=A0A5E4MQR4_9HEMI|nr:Hypothetical protein CINCED_3A005226 [Cinara cedri]